MLRPWLAALALLGCVFVSFVIFAWSVGFRGAEVVGGLAEAAANARLEGLAMGLHREAAELWRAEVRRLRERGATEVARRSARFALANELRDAALLCATEGNTELAREWLAEAVQAAPERADILCLLTDFRTRHAEGDQRRLELLRLVHRTGSSCAHLMAAESFIEAGQDEVARAYIRRAIERAPQWAEAHLVMARLDLRAGNTAEAQASALHAMQHSTSLGTRLEATDVVRRAGGQAPARWETIARWAWRRYAWMLPSLVLFAVLLMSPALLRLTRSGATWVRDQCGMAESAS